MRKILYILVKGIFYISILLSMFLIGVVGYYLSPFVISMSLGQINQNRNIYDKRQVHIRGYLEVTGRPEKYKDVPDLNDSIISYEKGTIVGASLEYSEVLKSDETLATLRKELRDKNTGLRNNKVEGWYLAEVNVIAVVNDMSHDGITHCFAPDLGFKVQEIQQAAPIKFLSEDEFLTLIGKHK